MSDESRLARLVDARMRLRARLEAARAARGADASGAPLGSGGPNRHGKPKLPVGQTATRAWPVLDLGVHPEVSTHDYRLVVDGACHTPLTLGFADLLALPQVEEESDFHCVTTWSRFDVRFTGVRMLDLIALAAPHDDATHVMFHAYDGYTTNVSLLDATSPDVLVVHREAGVPLPREHGGPVRVVTPRLYAWKGAKWVNRIELMTANRPGFWEERGYSDTADPWRDDRYG